jgi:hypothetical protein
MSAYTPPSYSPPPSYATHDFASGVMTFAQKERLASVAEMKLGYLVSQKRREPSLRQVLLHAGFLERVLDSIDASTPESIKDEPLIEEDYQHVEMNIPEPAYELHKSLPSIVEVDEMEVDEVEEEDDEDFTPLKRTVSHRPGSPNSDDDSDEDLSDESDDDLPSPPPQYEAAPDHPLFNLFEVREKARREEFSNHYRIEHDDQPNIFLMNNSLAVAA